jgi:Tfp pilus assembly protein PilO
MNPSRTNWRRYGLFGALIATVAGYYLWIDRPLRASTERFREERQDKLRYIAEAEELRPRIQAAKIAVRDAEAHYAAWKSSLPTEGAVSAHYSTLTATIRSAGATVTKFEPLPPIKLASIQQAPLLVTLSGTHAQIAAALVNMEKMSSTIWVRDLRLTEAREDGKAVSCEVRLIVFANNADKSD